MKMKMKWSPRQQEKDYKSSFFVVFPTGEDEYFKRASLWNSWSVLHGFVFHKAVIVSGVKNEI